MITLTNPRNEKKELYPDGISLIFHSDFLGPETSNSCIIYYGDIRSFKETVSEAAIIVGSHVSLVELSVPDDGVTSIKGAIWVAKEKILRVEPSENGSIIIISGNKGGIIVSETQEVIEGLLK